MYVLLNNLKPHGKMSMNLFMSECCIPAERIFRFNKLLKPDCFMVSVSHYSIYYAGLTYSLFSVIFKYLEGYMVSVFSRRHFHKNHIPFLFFIFSSSLNVCSADYQAYLMSRHNTGSPARDSRTFYYRSIFKLLAKPQLLLTGRK